MISFRSNSGVHNWLLAMTSISIRLYAYYPFREDFNILTIRRLLVASQFTVQMQLHIGYAIIWETVCKHISLNYRQNCFDVDQLFFEYCLTGSTKDVKSKF